jgi:hypothetical protein
MSVRALDPAPLFLAPIHGLHVAGHALVLCVLLAVIYSGSEAKAHRLQPWDEADNWEPFHARSHGWIFYAEMPNVYISKNTMLTYGESGRHSDTQSEYPQPLAGL